MSYITIKEASCLWGISERRITKLCNENRIDGAIKFGWSWAIPTDAKKPDDARVKSDKEKVNHIHFPEEPVLIRKWAMPNKNTFSIKPIKELISEELTDGLWIDPFANNNKFATITNDLNQEFDTDYHLDALDFLKLFNDNSIDGILYDPPYSPRQVSECYNDVGYNVTWDTTKASFWSNHKKEISRILKIGGKGITFGWNSGGIGMSYGFKKTKILLVPHGGWHNDTICTVELKIENKSNNKYNTGEKVQMKKKETDNDKKIINWIENLPADFWDFKSEDTRELTHGFHSYPAIMIYPISRNIIKKMKDIYTINSLFDPFSGSGTVPVEGMIANIPTVYATDLNPLSIILTKVKTKVLDKSELLKWHNLMKERIEELISENSNIIFSLENYIIENNINIYDKHGWGDNAKEILKDFMIQHGFSTEIVTTLPDFKNLGYWFKPNVVLHIQIIKNVLETMPDLKIKNFFMISLSETIRLASNKRNGEFKMYRIDKKKLPSFNPNVLNVFFEIVDKNISRMDEFYKIVNNNNSIVKTTLDDARFLTTIPNNSIDLIITSPPYGDSRTTVAYGEFSKLSLQWVGLDENSLDIDINKIDKELLGGKNFNNGFEFDLCSPTLGDALQKISALDIKRSGDVYSFYNDLNSCLSKCSQKSKINTYQFWVVGNRTVKGVYLKTDEILVELAKEHNLHHVTTFTRNIHNKVMPSLNSPTNEKGKTVTTMTNEFIVVLRKV